jgi:hypothetical protein
MLTSYGLLATITDRKESGPLKLDMIFRKAKDIFDIIMTFIVGDELNNRLAGQHL